MPCFNWNEFLKNQIYVFVGTHLKSEWVFWTTKIYQKFYGFLAELVMKI